MTARSADSPAPAEPANPALLANPAEPGERAEMVADRDRALVALVSLDTEWAAGEIDEASYRGLRDDYTTQAAAAIRGLAADAEVFKPLAPPVPLSAGTDGAVEERTLVVDRRPEPVLCQSSGEAAATSEADPSAPGTAQDRPPTSEGRRTRTRRRWMLPGAVFAFVIAAGILVGRYTATRQPGQQISGSPPITSAPSSQEVSAAAAADLLQGRTLLSQNQDVAAAKDFADVLAIDPHQPEALAYEGWVLRLAGVSGHNAALVSQGRAFVAEAIALDPSYPDAHVFLGFMYFQDVHNDAGAVAQFKDFLADHPLPALVQRTAPVIAQAFTADHQSVPAPVVAAVRTGAK